MEWFTAIKPISFDASRLNNINLIDHNFVCFYSGVAVSCGECSSSGTSDITEPGSPCSTSSDEGVAIGGTAGRTPLPSLPKLAPTTSSMHNGTRPQWPWTPPLAVTACTTYKAHKGEPEVGTLPKVGAADPTARAGKTTLLGKQPNHHEHQGKITEYFKTQIKPQQLKASIFTQVYLKIFHSSQIRRSSRYQSLISHNLLEKVHGTRRHSQKFSLIHLIV